MSFRLSVRPSVFLSAWNNSGSIRRNLMKLYICVFFDNMSKKIQFSLKSDKNNGHFIWKTKYIYDNISLNTSYNEKFSD
jgi:hypothetical protein